jgi:transposase-like protein
MGKAVTITRTEHSSPELRSQAAKCDDADQARRLLAVAMVLEGASREDAARLVGMDRQTLRDWVHRYNDEGIDGLRSRKTPGQLPRLIDEQRAELRQLVLDGPGPRGSQSDPLASRRFAYRGGTSFQYNGGQADGREAVAQDEADPAVTASIPSRRKMPKRRRLLEKLLNLPEESTGRLYRRDTIEIRFQDDARVGQNGSLAYIWARVGSRPPTVRDNRHDNAYIFGAICPDRAIGAAIITLAANTECMNLHLAEISTQVASGAIAAIICDGAGWHAKGQYLEVPENIVRATTALRAGTQFHGKRVAISPRQ